MNPSLARFLRRIPPSNQSAAALSHLASDDQIEMLRGFVAALRLWGMVTHENDHVRATSQTAWYALHSLAEWIESGEPIVSDWHTRGLHSEALFNGATLLSHMDTERQRRLPDSLPSRIERVAQVLIKRTHPTTHEPELLFQFDQNARRYQLVGGRYSPRDHDDLRTTMIREIGEELAVSGLVYEQDYQLQEVVSQLSLPPLISPTFGALTAYTFVIFHMVHLTRPLILNEGDRWIRVADVLANHLPDAPDQVLFSPNHTLYLQIDQAVHGLANLADSVRSDS